jgi:phosphoribosylglycinamide formyltransferase-1
VKITGATVHFVTTELDGGPIVLQEAVPVRDEDNVESLSARILVAEHRLYPEAVRLVTQGGWRVEGRRVIFGHARKTPAASGQRMED